MASMYYPALLHYIYMMGLHAREAFRILESMTSFDHGLELEDCTRTRLLEARCLFVPVLLSLSLFICSF
jgi:hypothetical protein